MKRQSALSRGMAAVLVAGTLSLAAVSVCAETVLIMVEEAGCMWCALWNRQIAPIYPKTAEGQAAPLRRIDIHDALPSDIVFSRRLAYTPTFVLVEEGKEVARIEGYPGADFFWGLLGQMLTEAGIAHERSG